jgi:hypothetical protein
MTHSYSKSFEYNPRPFRYRPDEFADTINQWLAEQNGLRSVTMTVTFLMVAIKTVTVNCVASNSLDSPQVRLTRVPLNSGTKGRKLQPAGEVLNSWTDQNPDKRRLNYWTVVSSGVPVELWLLYVENSPLDVTE